MPLKTETRILRQLALGNPLTDAQKNQLLAKIDKGQKKSRARDITASTEFRYAAQIASMTPQQQAVVQRAITDYSNDSTAINNSCRSGAPNPAALNIDQMFQAYALHNFENYNRITYRLMTYSATAHIPYGATTGNQIAVGDHITDAAFVSSSENRQLLVNGVENPAAGTRYVKFAISGPGGVNISGGSQYTNANEQALCKQLYPKTWKARTAHAGQAEVLYNRAKVFQVEKISQEGNDVHVVLSIPTPQPVGGTKNSYTGV